MSIGDDHESNVGKMNEKSFVLAEREGSVLCFRFISLSIGSGVDNNMLYLAQAIKH